WGPQAIGDHGAPVSLPKLQKAYEKGTRGISWGPLLTGNFFPGIWKKTRHQNMLHLYQGRTDNSWGPWAIGDHGAPVSWPTLKPHPKKSVKGTRDISWGPLLTPGPRAVPKFPNGQSAP
ncbi:unnamed protein product, partial [Staurois parvus]